MNPNFRGGHLKEWKAKLDFDGKVLTIGQDTSINLEINQKGHYVLDLVKEDSEEEKIRETLFTDCHEKELVRRLEKLHLITAHCQEEALIRFLKGSKNYKPGIKPIISEIIARCVTCNRMRKLADKPKASLPKATKPNEIISIDLKEMTNEKCFILFITDEFTRYTRGEVIKNKTPQEVVSPIERNWILRGPGYPSKGFFSDRGTEFCNSLMKEYVRKLGLTHKTTLSFSPFSNGLNECNHSTVDRAVTKIRIQNPDIPLQEAVDLGCFWKNQEIRKSSGFSSHQLVYGRGVIIPGVIDSDIASDSPAYSDEVAELFARHSRARQLHLKADTDRRIKKLLATRNKEYNNYKFQEGDKIFVKDLHRRKSDFHTYTKSDSICAREKLRNSHRGS